MLQASSERPAAGAGRSLLWVPGMTPPGLLMGAGSARAQEIARRREEMMGMLRDLPESEYELSLTDLVEKQADATNNNAERKEPEPEPDPAGRRSAPGGGVAVAQQQVQVQVQQQPSTTAGGRPERRRSRREGGGSSFRSSSDGVLLNFYMPRSLTRSFTAPRPGGRTPSISGSVASDCSNRERDADTVKCWSLPWDRPWRKSGRRAPAAPPKDNVRAAILKAAKHAPSSSPKV